MLPVPVEIGGRETPAAVVTDVGDADSPRGPCGPCGPRAPSFPSLPLVPSLPLGILNENDNVFLSELKVTLADAELL